MLSMTSRRHNCVLSRFRTRKAAMFPSLQDSKPVRWSYSRVWIRSRMEHAWMCKRPDRPTAPVPAAVAGAAAAAKAGETAHEHIEAVYPSTGCDIIADGRSSACGSSRLQAVAGLGAAPGRLPDDPGRYLLSGREPGRDVLFRDGAARAPVRTSSRTEADDLHELVRMLRHHASVLARPQYRYRGAGN